MAFSYFSTTNVKLCRSSRMLRGPSSIPKFMLSVQSEGSSFIGVPHSGRKLFETLHRKVGNHYLRHHSISVKAVHVNSQCNSIHLQTIKPAIPDPSPNQKTTVISANSSRTVAMTHHQQSRYKEAEFRASMDVHTW